MKIILLSIVFFLGSLEQSEKTTVYICGSEKAPRYHYNSKCRGLNKCDYKILKTTLATAQAKGKTLCKWED